MEKEGIMEEFTDKEGKKRRRLFDNGLEETILVEPSQWYIDNVMKLDQVSSAERKKRMKKTEKIAQKLREMAEKELEKEENG